MLGLGERAKPAELVVQWHADVGDHVQDLAWSPDGELLVAATISGPVFLYRGPDFVREIPAHRDGTNSICWSPDGRSFATGGIDGTIRLWDTAGLALGERAAGEPWVEQVRFNHDGTLLASAAGRTVRLWRGDELVRELKPHASTVTGVAWRPGRKQLACIGYGGVALIDPVIDEEPTLLAWKGSLLVGAWNTQGSRFAAGLQDNSVHVWQPDTTQDWNMDGYMHKVREIAWDRSGKILATGGSSHITCWDFHGDGPSGSQPAVCDGHAGPLAALAYHPADDLLASGGRDGTLVWWRRGRPTHMALTGPPISRLAWKARQPVIAVGCEDGLLGVYGRS
ncbi:MAG: WD40 repeat domain-containing protein [Planctomycetes bacterium]|nr:WD40 repeat domain-containing protein [Planctomycetota bacterium]